MYVKKSLRVRERLESDQGTQGWKLKWYSDTDLYLHPGQGLQIEGSEVDK